MRTRGRQRKRPQTKEARDRRQGSALFRCPSQRLRSLDDLPCASVIRRSRFPWPKLHRAADNSCTNRIIGVICPFCPLAFLLSAYQSGRWLVGAVGIESNDVRNFKDLRGMLRNTKLLKRNKRARKGTLIAPSKLPRFSSVADILNVDFCTHCLQLRSASCPRIAARMASRLFA